MAVNRELVVSYAGYRVNPEGKVRIERGYERSVVEYSSVDQPVSFWLMLLSRALT